MYDAIYRHFLFPTVQRLMRRNTMEDLEHLEKTQWWPYEELQQHQFDRVKRQIELAYAEVPYYRRRFRELQIEPGEIKSWDDFSRIPLLTKEQLRADPKLILVENPTDKLKLTITGGSTGQPMRYYYDQTTLGRTQAIITRSRRWWGIEPGDRTVLLWGHYRSFDRSLGGRVANYLKYWRDMFHNRRWISAYNMSAADMKRYHKIMREFRPKVIIGYTSALTGLATFFRDQSLPADQVGLNGIISTSELLFDWQKRLMEEVFGCPVIDEYGLVELGIVSYTCPHGNRHLIDDNLYIEIVDSNGRVTTGTGELVATQLFNHSSPMIRYATGDVGRISQKPCPCGRGLRYLEALDGRVLDLLTLPDGGYASPHLVAQILESFPVVRNMQIVQTSVDELLVMYEATEPLTNERQKFLIAQIQERFGPSIQIRLNQTDHIDKEGSGKFRWSKNLIPGGTPKPERLEE